MRHLLAPLLATSLFSAPAAAESLQLSLDHTVPLTNLVALGLQSIGDLAMDDPGQRLWIADGSSGGILYRISTVNGSIFGTANPAVIPGLNGGPDALAAFDTAFPAQLHVFSSFGQSEGGRITSAGTLLNDYGQSYGATGADFDLNGNLWLATGTTVGGGCTLKRIDRVSGAVLQTTVIGGTTSRVVDLAFDPHTNACYVLLESAPVLIEVNTTTGAQLSSTDVSAFVTNPNIVTGGIEFNRTGTEFYIATGSAAANVLYVLTRDFDVSICDGTGASTACPCGNVGLLGRGCDNSFATGGALLDGVGYPSVTADSFALHASGLPPTTSCLFFQGTTIPESVPAVFGDGLRCVVGTVIRLGTKTSVAGSATYPGITDPLIHVRGSIPTFGGTRFYQAWYRNSAAFCTPSGFNLSNGIKVSWAP